MKITLTIEIDVQRQEGANVRKQDVAGAIMDQLFERYGSGETFVAYRNDDYAWVRTDSIIIFPHEDSRPPADYPPAEGDVRPGDECPTCKITQFSRSVASPGT